MMTEWKTQCRLPIPPPDYVWYIRASWIDNIPIIKSTISYLLSPPNVGVPTRIKRHSIVFVVRTGLEPAYLVCFSLRAFYMILPVLITDTLLPDNVIPYAT